jgi:hypothetical protein
MTRRGYHGATAVRRNRQAAGVPKARSTTTSPVKKTFREPCEQVYQPHLVRYASL